MIEQRTSGVTLDLARLGEAGERAPRPPQVRQKLVERGAMILEPIVPTVLSVRRLPNADPAMIRAYGGDPEQAHRRSASSPSIRTIRRTSRSTRRRSTRRST